MESPRRRRFVSELHRPGTAGAGGRSAEGVEQKGDFILLDQLASLLNGFRRAVAVILRKEFDLPATNTTLIVDPLERAVSALPTLA
jgi:hypothetical protein